jgi:hypothetical protein
MTSVQRTFWNEAHGSPRENQILYNQLIVK